MEKLLLRPRSKPDGATQSCDQCEAKFTLTNRRVLTLLFYSVLIWFDAFFQIPNNTYLITQHHCRCCGGVFCAQCSSKSKALPELRYAHVRRVCDICWRKTSNEIMLEVKARITSLPLDIQAKLEAMAQESIQRSTDRTMQDDDDDSNSSEGESDVILSPVAEKKNRSSTIDQIRVPNKSFYGSSKYPERSSYNILGPWCMNPPQNL